MSDLSEIVGLDDATAPPWEGTDEDPESHDEPAPPQPVRSRVKTTQAKAEEAPVSKPPATKTHKGWGVTADELMDLHAPTPKGEVKQRRANPKDPSSKMLDYVDARFVQQRLDDVCGPTNWRIEYIPIPGMTPSEAVRARLGILVRRDEAPAFAEWLDKEDVGTASNIEGIKGSHSDAFKRAGVLWGIARDLYDDNENVRPSAPTTSVPRQRITQEVGELPDPASALAPDVAVRTLDDDGEEVFPWMCPIHGEVKVVPAGISKAGRKYPAFYACPDRDCDQTGGRVPVHGA
jgi:hypothetical protein